MTWHKLKGIAAQTDYSVRAVREWPKLGLRHSRMPSGTIIVKQEWLDEWLESFEVKPEHPDQVDKIVNDVFADLMK